MRRAQGERQAAILQAEGEQQAAILESEGRAQAIATVYAAIKRAEPDPTLVAILQLDALAKFAESDNAKIVVPYESAALLGAAQTLRSVLGRCVGQRLGPVAASAQGRHLGAAQEFLDGGADLVGGVEQDEVAAAPHDMQAGIRDEGGQDAGVDQRHQRVVVAAHDEGRAP